jgi:hypothetical protein
MQQTYLIFGLLAACALIGFIAYRLGMATTAKALRPYVKSLETHASTYSQHWTDSQLHNRTLESKAETLSATVDDLLAKQEHHQAQLEAIMIDADNRIAAYAKRANPFNESHLAQLLCAVDQLDLAGRTYKAMGSDHGYQKAETSKAEIIAMVGLLDSKLQGDTVISAEAA